MFPQNPKFRSHDRIYLRYVVLSLKILSSANFTSTVHICNAVVLVFLVIMN